MQIWNRLFDANQQTNCVVVGKSALKALCTPSSTGKACCWCASASHCCHLYSVMQSINQSSSAAWVSPQLTEASFSYSLLEEVVIKSRWVKLILSNLECHVKFLSKLVKRAVNRQFTAYVDKWSVSHQILCFPTVSLHWNSCPGCS